MFKNYLTYSLALSFHRSCLALGEVPSEVKNRLMRSSETMIEHFSKSIHAPSGDVKTHATHLYVALICLRDCREIIESAKISEVGFLSQYEVIHGRLEQLCLDAADKSGGQIRMLG